MVLSFCCNIILPKYFHDVIPGYNWKMDRVYESIIVSESGLLYFVFIFMYTLMINFIKPESYHKLRSVTYLYIMMVASSVICLYLKLPCIRSYMHHVLLFLAFVVLIISSHSLHNSSVMHKLRYLSMHLFLSVKNLGPDMA